MPRAKKPVPVGKRFDEAKAQAKAGNNVVEGHDFSNLRGTLSNSDLTYRNCNFDGSRIREVFGKIENCSFKGCYFEHVAGLRPVDEEGLKGSFRNCSFKGAHIHGVISGVFENCDFSGIQAGGVRVSAYIQNSQFLGAILSKARLKNTNLKNVSFQGSDMTDLTIAGFLALKCEFTQCSFGMTSDHSTLFSSCDFSGSVFDMQYYKDRFEDCKFDDIKGMKSPYTVVEPSLARRLEKEKKDLERDSKEKEERRKFNEWMRQKESPYATYYSTHVTNEDRAGVYQDGFDKYPGLA